MPPAEAAATAVTASRKAGPPSAATTPDSAAGQDAVDPSAAAAEQADNNDHDDPEPPPSHHVWPTSSLTETFADMRKRLAQLQQSGLAATTAASATSSATAAADGASTVMSNAVSAIRSSLGQHIAAPVRTAMTSSSSSSSSSSSTADSAAARGPALDESLFRLPPRFAVPAASPPGAPGAAERTEPRMPHAPQGQPAPAAREPDDPRRHAAHGTLSPNSMSAKRLIQLTGPGGPGSFQTAPAGSVAWSLDGVVRQHGVGPPAGGIGAPSMVGGSAGGQRGYVAGTLAGSLHGGVNVLLGGAMLSGLILLVFFICYCCQRSARKSDAHFRTQYWLPDPDGPLEVFTLDAQTQRLERAGAVLLPSEPLEAMMASPSPPPAYHTVVSLPPLCKPADSAVASPASPAAIKEACPAAPAVLACGEVDADGLPSYEAALKLEGQGHI